MILASSNIVGRRSFSVNRDSPGVFCIENKHHEFFRSGR